MSASARGFRGDKPHGERLLTLGQQVAEQSALRWDKPNGGGFETPQQQATAPDQGQSRSMPLTSPGLAVEFSQRRSSSLLSGGPTEWTSSLQMALALKFAPKGCSELVSRDSLSTTFAEIRFGWGICSFHPAILSQNHP